MGEYLGIREIITLDQLQINRIKNNPKYKLFGIYKDHGHYISYTIVNKEDVITCKYKNSLGQKVERLE